MKAEFVARRWRPLIGEASGNVLRCEFDPLGFELIAIEATDQHILGHASIVNQHRGSGEKLFRSKRETAVANIVTVQKVRPRGSDIIKLKKSRDPRTAGDD